MESKAEEKKTEATKPTEAKGGCDKKEACGSKCDKGGEKDCAQKQGACSQGKT